LAFENSQAAENRQAGVLQDRQLAREDREMLRADATDSDGFAFAAALLFLGLLAGLLHGDLRDEVAHLLDRELSFFLAGRVNDILDVLAAGVHSLELI